MALSLVRGECTTALYNRLAREKVAKAKREEEEKDEKEEEEEKLRKINRTSHKGWGKIKNTKKLKNCRKASVVVKNDKNNEKM